MLSPLPVEGMCAQYLQGVDGDGAAPPAVQVTHCINCCCAAKQHHPAEEILLGNGEQDLEHTGAWRRAEGFIDLI